ncbi:MAG: SurA N-terminal domain-containing protein [Candidatus Methylomirabilales bacterium]
MRDNVKSLSITLWLVIFSFIATIFVVWGIQSTPGQSGPAVVATVNGVRITGAHFQETYRARRDSLRRMYGDQWNDKLIEDLDLRRRVLDGLITDTLLLQEADRLGLRVSDAELAQAIKTNPIFAEQGTFSRTRYLALLDANRLTPESFEDQVRNDLLRQKVIRLIREAVKVSELEAWEGFRTAQEKVQVTYVALPRSAEAKVKLEQLRERLEKGDSWEKVLQESGLKAMHPTAFTFREPVVDPSDSGSFRLAAFRLRKEGTLSPVVEGGQSFFLIKLLDRQVPDRETFDKTKETWIAAVRAAKQQQIVAEWIQGLRHRAKISVQGGLG